MKKTIFMLTLAILLLIGTAVPAFAAGNNIDDNHPISVAILNNRELLEGIGINIDNHRGGSLNIRVASYTGSDFSEQAIRERIAALEIVFPHDMEWGPRQRVDCNIFTEYANRLVFSTGRNSSVVARRHNDWSQLRVGDIISYMTRNRSMHTVMVIEIGDNGVLTVAEGNIGGRVGWGRTFTMTTAQEGRRFITPILRETGHELGFSIQSPFDVNGNIMLSNDENGRTILRDFDGSEAFVNSGRTYQRGSGVPTGFQRRDENPDGTFTTTTWNLDGSIRDARETGAPTPAVTGTTPAAPAQTPTTTAPTAPAVTTPTTPTAPVTREPVAPHNSFIVTNDGTRMTIDSTNANGSTATSRMTISNGGRGTSNGVSGTTITLTLDDRTYTVEPGESVTIAR